MDEQNMIANIWKGGGMEMVMAQMGYLSVKHLHALVSEVEGLLTFAFKGIRGVVALISPQLEKVHR